MEKLSFFDCNCSVGRVAYPNFLDISDSGGLLDEMRTVGVDEALVFHTAARDADPPLGNRLLTDEIGGLENLKPVWVVMPHHTGEFPEPAKLLATMEKAGVKAVRMYPTKDYHSFSLAQWNSGDLLSALEEASVPLMLDLEIVWWEAIQSVLERHPNLPVIAFNVSYRHNRFTYPLFERYQNLYVETSRYYGAGTIEDVVKRFGSGHILFGTNMPFCTGTTAVALISYADIPVEDKQAIAGDNLRALLKEVYA